MAGNIGILLVQSCHLSNLLVNRLLKQRLCFNFFYRWTNCEEVYWCFF